MSSSGPPLVAPPSPRPSIGAYLRRQRELREVSIGELAELTRIPLRSLERLESGAFDRDVDGFVRGFVRTVARALGLDADEAISRLLEEPVADDRGRGQDHFIWHRALLAMLAVAMLVATLGLLAFVVQQIGSPPASSGEGDVVFRRDPVRELAESEAARAEDGVGPVIPAVPAVPVPELPDVSSPALRRGESPRAR